MSDPLDLRLVPPALAAWAAALVVVHAPAAIADGVPVLAVLLTGAGATVLAAAVRAVVTGRVPGTAHDAAGTGPTGGEAGPRSGCRPALALAAVTAVVVLLAGGLVQNARLPPPLVAAAAEVRVVEAVGTVTAPPRVVPGGVRLAVVLARVRVDGTWWAVRAPVDVVAPSPAPVGATVHVRGRVTPTAGAQRAAVRLRTSRPLVVRDAASGAHAWAQDVREGARAVAAPLPPDVRGLLPAVTVGDTDGVPQDLVVAMRTAGLAHVMAVSGAHFAVLAGLVLAAAAAARAPRPVQVGAVAVTAAGLLLVVGPGPSVVRAAVMAAVGLVGLLAGRRAAGVAALAAAVVVLLVADPWLAVDVGFALSVAATAGLVLLAGPLVDRWSGRCGRPLATALGAPVAAQVGCLPVALAVWPSVGTWALPANLAVAPAVAPATVLGLAAALVADVAPPLADALGATAGAACWWIAAVARVAAGLPGAAVPWTPGPVGALAAGAVAVATAVLVLRAPTTR